MKRIACILVFALFGLIFVIGTPFLFEWVMIGDGDQRLNEDIANQQVRLFILLGGILFAGLWGWIGNKIYSAWRQGLMAGAGAVVGTAIAIPVGRIFSRLIDSPASGDRAMMGTVVFLLFWCSVAAGFASFGGRAKRPPN
jgi:hypothetical protein